MVNGTAATPVTRGVQRESVLLTVTPVDEKRFESELRRLDASVSEDRKNREKFETRVEKSIDMLRGDINKRFDKLEAYIKDFRKELKDRLRLVFWAIILSTLLSAVQKYI